MGKLKKNSRSSRHRANPLAVRSKESKQDEQIRQKILPLVAKLQSAAPNDRSMGLGTISIMCDDPKFRKMLLREKLVQIVMEQCLTDSNSEIVVESFGLLRNLVIEEGYDVAVYLWRQNIWRVVQQNLNKSQRGFEMMKEGQVDKLATTLLFDMIENLVALVTGLCDASEDILATVMGELEGLKKFLKEVLEYSLDIPNEDLKVPVSLFNAIFDLIYSFSSQSEEFIKSLKTWDLNLELLENFVDTVPKFNTLAQVYIQGVKLQTSDQYVQIINKIITSIFSIDINRNRNIIVAETDNSKPEEIKNDVKKRAAARAEFQAVELSVEIITAVMEMSSYNESLEDAFIHLATTSVPELLTSLLPHLEFRSRVLTALNNLSWLFITVNDGLQEWSQIAPSVWGQLGGLIADSDVEEKLSLFGTLWAILHVCELPLDDSFVQQVMQELESSLTIDDELKDDYAVRLVGVLARLARGSVDRNRAISEQFLRLLNAEVPRIVLFEMLDQFYELYDDASYAYDIPVFKNLGYLQKLKDLQPKVKQQYKLVDKNKNPELKAKAEDVFNNLGRFIDYKANE